jgi:NADPH:quinone reductase-like Zn-dependent oxidoreductase
MPSLLTLSGVYLTGYQAARQGGVGPGKTVTVIGGGAVGLSAVLASQQLGAKRIILMGRHIAVPNLGAVLVERTQMRVSAPGLRVGSTGCQRCGSACAMLTRVAQSRQLLHR